MVRQHGQVTQLCLLATDVVVITAAWLLSFFVRFTYFPHTDVPSLRSTWIYFLLVLMASLMVISSLGLYRPRRDKSFLQEFGQLIKATFIAWVLVIVFIYFTHSTPFTRKMLFIFPFVMMGGLIIERGLFRSFLRFIRRRGWNLRHALIIGTGRLGQSTLHRIQANTWTGIRVTGFVDTHNPCVRQEIRGFPVIGPIANILHIVESYPVDCVFVALPAKHGEHLRQILAQLEQTSVDVRIVPDLFQSRYPTNVAISDLDGMPILSVRDNPLVGWPGLYKRCFDLFGAAFGLLLLAPVMVLLAIGVKMTSPGPVIYRQRRISYGGRSFDMFKFRTMRVDAEAQHGPAFAMRDDPRCTPLGKWLRSLSLDELPQLFNVLWGDMSLVGPRPERPEMLAKIRKEVPLFPQRLKVRAGLTGWAQVNGFRGRTSFRKRLQYDLYYLNNWSPLFDLRIVMATFFRGFRHPNAY